MSMKICFAASSGGHLEEISRMRPIAENYDSFLLTERGASDTSDFVKRVYLVNQINRKEWSFLFKFIGLCFNSIRILNKEKPDCIISVGALATYPICLFAKLRGTKVIYIESFARVDCPSLTGKLMYKIADLFIVQWEELLEVFPKAMYGGRIF